VPISGPCGCFFALVGLRCVILGVYSECYHLIEATASPRFFPDRATVAQGRSYRIRSESDLDVPR
jgi:hypothetical protein